MGWKGISVDRLIAKLSGGKIGHESISTYIPFLGLLDFTSDDDVPNLRAVKSLLTAPPAEVIKFASGSALSAAVIDMTIDDRGLFGLNPTVIREINKVVDSVTDNTIKTPADDITYYKQYTDNTYVALSSITINGHDDGAGNFAEDTYITLKG